ncbi:hypothetical protein J6590_072466 [Homalodisca vitripennis]|nr:hypothetical protein J6590_072466 [Homalodisca vitripennis]
MTSPSREMRCHLVLRRQLNPAYSGTIRKKDDALTFGEKPPTWKDLSVYRHGQNKGQRKKYRRSEQVEVKTWVNSGYGSKGK